MRQLTRLTYFRVVGRCGTPRQIAYNKLYNIWHMSLADIDHFVALITVDNVQGFMNEMAYLEKAVDRRHLNDPGAYMKSVLTSYFSSLEDLSQEVVLLPSQEK